MAFTQYKSTAGSQEHSRIRPMSRIFRNRSRHPKSLSQSSLDRYSEPSMTPTTTRASHQTCLTRKSASLLCAGQYDHRCCHGYRRSCDRRPARCNRCGSQDDLRSHDYRRGHCLDGYSAHRYHLSICSRAEKSHI